MKKNFLAIAALLPLLSLTACDSSKTGTPEGPSTVQNDSPPAPAQGPANGYAEHIIFNDRYSSVLEITYVSPVDGKSMICTVYSSGVGTGNSCRVKE